MEGRRRVTLYDRMKAGDTSNSRNSLASFLNDVVSNNQNQKTRNHTLLDVIQEDGESNGTNTTMKDRKSWKSFKDMLRLKRRNSDESNRELEQQNDVVEEEIADNSNQSILVTVAGGGGGGGGGGGESSIEEETRQVSMSLMDLLEETEVDLDLRSDEDCDGDDRKQEEEEEREEGSVVDDNVEHNCCVCMVRHKGAAFIPCGHTFCRMCSREIWVSRGNCPLCNNLILEILDLF